MINPPKFYALVRHLDRLYGTYMQIADSMHFRRQGFPRVCVHCMMPWAVNYIPPSFPASIVAFLLCDIVLWMYMIQTMNDMHLQQVNIYQSRKISSFSFWTSLNMNFSPINPRKNRAFSPHCLHFIITIHKGAVRTWLYDTMV